MSNATATVMSCMRTQKLNANGGCAILWPQLGEMAAVRMVVWILLLEKKNWKLGKVKHQESWSPNCSFCKWFLFGLVLRAEFHERIDSLTTHHLQFRHFWQGLSTSHFTRRHFKLPSKSIPCSVAGGRCSTFISSTVQQQILTKWTTWQCKGESLWWQALALMVTSKDDLLPSLNEPFRRLQH